MPKNRRPQATVKRTEPSVSPPPTENNQQKGWLRSLLQLPNVVVTAALIALLSVFVQRWATVSEENTRLNFQLERREDQIKNQDQELKNLRTENEGLKRLHPILQFYGSNARLIRSFVVKKEKGAKISIGNNCPQAPCLEFTMDGIRNDDGIDKVELLLEGDWEGMVRTGNPIRIFVPLKKGCRTTFTASRYDIVFVVEDTDYSNVTAGIAISIASSPEMGIKAKGLIRCP